jgi:DNA-binding NarL/FixJ family response regulator
MTHVYLNLNPNLMTTFKPGVVLAVHTISHFSEAEHSTRNVFLLNEREMEFMKLVCTEWTYKEIADRMYLSPRTIDGYRDALFEKLNVRTRVGLAMYAVRSGIVSIDSITSTSKEMHSEALAKRKSRSVGKLARRL